MKIAKVLLLLAVFGLSVILPTPTRGFSKSAAAGGYEPVGSLTSVCGSDIYGYSVTFHVVDVTRAAYRSGAVSIRQGDKGSFGLNISRTTGQGNRVEVFEYQNPTGAESGLSFTAKNQPLFYNFPYVLTDFRFQADINAVDGVYFVDFGIFYDQPGYPYEYCFRTYLVVSSSANDTQPLLQFSNGTFPASLVYGSSFQVSFALTNVGNEAAGPGSADTANGIQVRLEGGRFNGIVTSSFDACIGFNYDDPTHRYDCQSLTPIVEVVKEQIGVSDKTQVQLNVVASRTGSLQVKIATWWTEQDEQVYNTITGRVEDLIYRTSPGATVWPFNIEWAGTKHAFDTSRSSQAIAIVEVSTALTASQIGVDQQQISQGQSNTLSGNIASQAGVNGNTATGTWYYEYSTDDGASWTQCLGCSGTVSQPQSDSGFSFDTPQVSWTPDSQGEYLVRTRYSGESNYDGSSSSPVSLSVGPPPINTPDPPRNPSATAQGSTILVQWQTPFSNGGSPITGYDVYRGTSPNSETFYQSLGNDISYTDTSVVCQKTYHYEVSAVNVAGEGPRSDEVSASLPTSNCVPLAAQDLLATSQTNQITLSWQAPEGGSTITGYKIYRGTSPGQEGFLVGIGVVTSYTDSSISSGVTYFYTVRAFNEAGEGSSSNEASAAAAQPLTGNFTVTVDGPSGGPIQDATVTLVSGPAGQVLLALITGADGTVTFDGLLPGSYSYTVTAKGYQSSEAVTVTVKSGQPTSSQVNLDEVHQAGIDPLVYIAMGLGITGLVIGSAVFLTRRRRRDTERTRM